MLTDKKFAVVTATSTHRMRYVIPIDDLQEMNKDYIVDPKWALDCVTMEEVEEFSQAHLGEQIVDLVEMDINEILDLFDKDNEYLKDWSVEQKIKFICDWKAKHK
jgi:predicted house-cleaning noncanonical NTP pyrophosphatase (MazG superfamily)